MKAPLFDLMEHVSAACERSTGGKTGVNCQNRYAKKVWHRSEEGESTWSWGDGEPCGAPFFLSRETNRPIPCGACEIRMIECVEEAKKVKRAQEHMDGLQPDDMARPFFSRKIDLSIRALTMQIQMSGCDSDAVFARATREIKRENEWAARDAAAKK